MLVPHRIPPRLYRLIARHTGHVGPLSELSQRLARQVTDADRRRNPFYWGEVMGGHLALWRSDCLAVGGFDERYKGWGPEDKDLVVRLIHAGSRVMHLYNDHPVIHLEHPRRPESAEGKTIFEDVVRSLRRQPLRSLLVAGEGRTEPEPCDRL
jgi:hypothetical protein